MSFTMHWLLQKSGSGEYQTTQKPSWWWQKNKGWKSTKLFSILLKFTKPLIFSFQGKIFQSNSKGSFATSGSYSSWDDLEEIWSDSNFENAPISWTWLWKMPNTIILSDYSLQMYTHHFFVHIPSPTTFHYETEF